MGEQSEPIQKVQKAAEQGRLFDRGHRGAILEPSAHTLVPSWQRSDLRPLALRHAPGEEPGWQGSAARPEVVQQKRGVQDWRASDTRPRALQQKREAGEGGTGRSARTLPAAGAGQALPEPVLAKMETALGSDFSAVRVHEDGQAAALGAQAFASGNDIHFAPGKYEPDSSQGQKLLGHELTHVVQQRQGRVQGDVQGSGLEVNADPGLELEADVLGEKAASFIPGQAALMAGAPGSTANALVQLKVVQAVKTAEELKKEAQEKKAAADKDKANQAKLAQQEKEKEAKLQANKPAFDASTQKKPQTYNPTIHTAKQVGTSKAEADAAAAIAAKKKLEKERLDKKLAELEKAHEAERVAALLEEQKSAEAQAKADQQQLEQFKIAEAQRLEAEKLEAQARLAQQKALEQQQAENQKQADAKKKELEQKKLDAEKLKLEQEQQAAAQKALEQQAAAKQKEQALKEALEEAQRNQQRMLDQLAIVQAGYKVVKYEDIIDPLKARAKDDNKEILVGNLEMLAAADRAAAVEELNKALILKVPLEKKWYQKEFKVTSWAQFADIVRKFMPTQEGKGSKEDQSEVYKNLALNLDKVKDYADGFNAVAIEGTKAGIGGAKAQNNDFKQNVLLPGNNGDAKEYKEVETELGKNVETASQVTTMLGGVVGFAVAAKAGIDAGRELIAQGATMTARVAAATDAVDSLNSMAMGTLDFVENAVKLAGKDIMSQAASDAAAGIGAVIAGSILIMQGIYGGFRAQINLNKLEALSAEISTRSKQLKAGASAATNKNSVNKSEAIGKVIKGAVVLTGGILLLSLGVSNPIGWMVLGAGALIGGIVLAYQWYKKNKLKKELVNKELLAGNDKATDEERRVALQKAGFASVNHFCEWHFRTTAMYLHAILQQAANGTDDDNLKAEVTGAQTVLDTVGLSVKLQTAGNTLTVLPPVHSTDKIYDKLKL